MTQVSTAAPARGTPTPRIWPQLTVLTAATLWTVTAELLPSGLLPEMSRGLAVGEGMIGALVSAWALTIAVVGIPLVRATLRVPRALLLTVSLAVVAATNLITAFAPDFTLALIGRILTATAHGLFWALVVSYVATIVEPARLGRTLSIVLSGPTIAGLAVLPASAFLVDFVGWRAVFAVLSGILAVTAVALWLVLPRQTNSHTDAAQPSDEPRGTWDSSAAGVIKTAVAGGLVLVGHFAAFTYVTALVTGFGGLADSAIPVALLVLGITGGLGIAVSGLAADRFPRWAIGVTAALIAVGLVVVRLGEGSPAAFMAGTALWGLAIGAFPPILQARVMRVASSSFRPLAGSIVVTVLNLGIAIGAALGGVILGIGPAWLVTTALLAAAVGAVLLLNLRLDSVSTETA